MEAGKIDQVMYFLGMALAAALIHTKQVLQKHLDWTPAQRLGSYITSLRRMLADVRPKGDLPIEVDRFHNSLELRLLDTHCWESPGVMKPDALRFANGHLGPGIDLRVAFDIADTLTQQDDFLKAWGTLIRLERGVQSLTYCSECVNLANTAADEIAASMEQVLGIYSELTNG